MVEVADTPERVKPTLCRACEKPFICEWAELYTYTYHCPCGKVWGWVVMDAEFPDRETGEGHLVSVRRKERRNGK